MSDSAPVFKRDFNGKWMCSCGATGNGDGTHECLPENLPSKLARQSGIYFSAVQNEFMDKACLAVRKAGHDRIAQLERALTEKRGEVERMRARIEELEGQR